MPLRRPSPIPDWCPETERVFYTVYRKACKLLTLFVCVCFFSRFVARFILFSISTEKGHGNHNCLWIETFRQNGVRGSTRKRTKRARAPPQHQATQNGCHSFRMASARHMWPQLVSHDAPKPQHPTWLPGVDAGDSVRPGCRSPEKRYPVLWRGRKNICI